jgi:hypothetical protein|tara:strand:- start:532 stop:648 length:117 start_codon:yes stop_codon:yes gene_type:complete
MLGKNPIIIIIIIISRYTLLLYCENKKALLKKGLDFYK